MQMQKELQMLTTFEAADVSCTIVYVHTAEEDLHWAIASEDYVGCRRKQLQEEDVHADDRRSIMNYTLLQKT